MKTEKLAAITAVVLMLSVAAAALVPMASDDSDAVGETHDVSNAAELALVGTGLPGPDSITWDPDDNYVQTADIVFGPSDDFNMGYDIRVECISAVLSSPGRADLTFTVEYDAGSGYTAVPNSSLSAVIGDRWQTAPIPVSSGQFTVSGTGTDAGNALYVYGAVTAEPVAFAVELPDFASVLGAEFVRSSNGNMDPVGYAGGSYADFTGTYDGNGYKISGLNVAPYYEGPNSERLVGFFARTNGATLSNIVLEDGSSVGIALFPTGWPATRPANGNGKIFTGGIVGAAINTSVIDCENGNSVYSFTNNGALTLGGVSGHMRIANAAASVSGVNSGGLFGNSYAGYTRTTLGGMTGSALVYGASGALDVDGFANLTDMNVYSNISNNTAYVGGLFGMLQNGIINESAVAMIYYGCIYGLPGTGWTLTNGSAGKITIADSFNDGDITAVTQTIVGGIMGGLMTNSADSVTDYMTVRNSHNAGDLYVINEFSAGAPVRVGGLAGEFYADYYSSDNATIVGSFNVGELRISDSGTHIPPPPIIDNTVGGLIAYAYGGVDIVDSFNSGPIVVDSYSADIFAGGLVGIVVKWFNIDSSYNNADITVRGGALSDWGIVGGLAAQLQTENVGIPRRNTLVYITDSYASGDLTVDLSNTSGNAYIGGIVGTANVLNPNYCLLDIRGSYTAVTVYTNPAVADTYVGGFIGVGPNNSTTMIYDSYYLYDAVNHDYPGAGYAFGPFAAGSQDPAGGVGNGGLSAAEMLDEDSYVGWDFTTEIHDGVWIKYEGYLPFLRGPGNDILVVPFLNPAATSYPNPIEYRMDSENTDPAMSDYITAHPLSGQLKYSGTAQGSAPTGGGPYTAELGTLNLANRWYQAAFKSGVQLDISAGTWSVTYADGSGGAATGMPSPNPTTVAKGGAVSVPAAAPAWTGYVFMGWKLTSGTVDGAGPSTIYAAGATTGAVQSNITLTAQWAVPTPGRVYTIFADADGGSAIVPSGNVGVPRGGSAVFAFSAKPGYTLSAVYVDGAAISSAAVASGVYVFSNVQSNHTISVASASDGGITLTVDIVGGDGVPKYHIGPSTQYSRFARSQPIALHSDVYVSLDIGDGYRFAGWTGYVESKDIEVRIADAEGDIHLVAHLESAGGGGEWAVLNLICAILAIAAGVAMLIAGRNRREKDDPDRKSKKAFLVRIASLAVGIFAAILFFATEDASLPAVPIDEWTLPMFILFLAAAALAAISLRFDRDREQP